MSLTSLITSSITDLYNLGTVFVFAEFAISTHNTNKRGGNPEKTRLKTKNQKEKKENQNTRRVAQATARLGVKISNKIES